MVRIHTDKCGKEEKQIYMSLDGVSESKSTSVSMDVFSTKFKNCRTIYPNRIVRPLGKVRLSNSEQFKFVLRDIKSMELEVEKFVGDNPKRSTLKGSLNHSAYYPCEYCWGKGVQWNTAKSEALRKQEEKKISEHNEFIASKIEFLKQNDTSDIKNLKISMLESLLKDPDKHCSKPRTQIVWPAVTRNSNMRTTEEVKEIVRRIENGERLTRDECKGIQGPSEFLYLTNFDYVKDAPAEYMHTTCLGLIKRLVELTFQVGENRPRKTTRKLSPVALFNKKMSEIKVTDDFSRRIRALDFAVMKAQEFRNLALVFFIIIIDCIEPGEKEIRLWLLLSFMLRACTLPNEEFQNIPKSKIKYCMSNFYIIFEMLFGAINCSYSVHVVCSHLLDIRGENPLTETSAFSFESFYSELRNSFTPGTTSTTKQILKNIYMKRILAPHVCKRPISVSAYDTAMECNSLVYTFVENKYHFYKIKDINRDILTCCEIEKKEWNTSDAGNLTWSQVGVFLKGNIQKEKVSVKLSDVKGKLVHVQNHLLTLPNNVLREK